MTTTKGDIITAVIRELRYPTSDSDLRTLVGEMFDDVLTHVLGGYCEWPERTAIRTLSVAYEGYTDSSFDADIAQCRRMRNQSTRDRIDPMTAEDAFDSGLDLTQTGTPRRWYPTEYDTTNGKQKFKLWPIPSADLTLEMHVDLGAPTPLEEAGVIQLPEDAIPVIKDGVRARAFYNDSKEDKGLIYEQKYELGLEKLKNKRASGRPERPSTMRMDGDLRGMSEYRNRRWIPDQIPYE